MMHLKKKTLKPIYSALKTKILATEAWLGLFFWLQTPFFLQGNSAASRLTASLICLFKKNKTKDTSLVHYILLMLL